MKLKRPRGQTGRSPWVGADRENQKDFEHVSACLRVGKSALRAPPPSRTSNPWRPKETRRVGPTSRRTCGAARIPASVRTHRRRCGGSGRPDRLASWEEISWPVWHGFGSALSLDPTQGFGPNPSPTFRSGRPQPHREYKKKIPDVVVCVEISHPES